MRAQNIVNWARKENTTLLVFQIFTAFEKKEEDRNWNQNVAMKVNIYVVIWRWIETRDLLSSHVTTLSTGVFIPLNSTGFGCIDSGSSEDRQRNFWSCLYSISVFFFFFFLLRGQKDF